MNLTSLCPNTQFAVDAVRQAGLLVRKIQREMVVKGLEKDDKSPVTVADFAGQAVVAKLMRDRFPDSVLVAEEGAESLRNGNDATVQSILHFAGPVTRIENAKAMLDLIDFGQADPTRAFWTLDPIDGTKGYLRKDQYAVALAYIENGVIQCGALACPNLNPDCSLNKSGAGAIAVAERGKGAWTLPLESDGALQPLKVSPERSIPKARMLRSFVSAHTNTDQLQEFSAQLGLKSEPVALDSQAKYALLAAGHGEILLRLLSASQPNYKEKIWDQAAGAIVTEEAGGKITDLAGNALDFTQGRSLTKNSGICATNGFIHDTIIEALAKL